ncbi:LacI family DNA-binding transcriptional regulator [Pseudomonas sp. HK3]|jgi:LacI family repressor for deo operon, udp, cdd, tsx, nupC, and nupG
MATMKDIARVAGVSTATVSRALMNPEVVKGPTRTKIQAAIDKLGYSPNFMARHLRTQKSQAIVVLVPDISNPFFATVIRGIEQVAHSTGYSVLLGDTQNDLKREASYANMVQTKQADGMILLGDRVPADIDPRNELRSIHSPLVMTCAYTPEDSIYNVFIDNTAAANKVVSHLLSKGHKKIGCIVGYKNTITQQRYEGFCQAMKAHGLDVNASWVVEGEFSSESGFTAAQKILEQDDRPTAIFSINDEMAMGALQAIKAQGLKVPEDIALVGFDDIRFSEYTDPPLTTVSQNGIDMGCHAMRMLIELMSGKQPRKVKQELDYELVIRQSC